MAFMKQRSYQHVYNTTLVSRLLVDRTKFENELIKTRCEAYESIPSRSWQHKIQMIIQYFEENSHGGANEEENAFHLAAYSVA